jgi:hypothetical protein
VTVSPLPFDPEARVCIGRALCDDTEIWQEASIITAQLKHCLERFDVVGGFQHLDSLNLGGVRVKLEE